MLISAVGTPPTEDGAADLQHVLAVARQLGQRLSGYEAIVTKFTVPVGTAEKVRQTIQEELAKRDIGCESYVVSEPELLKEGDVVNDFMRPDRIVIGVDSQRARSIMREFYAPLNRNHDRTIFRGVREAETTEYAANAMLATRISFMKEVANLCERMGVDAEMVRVGIGSDPRIGYSFLYLGCGYGSSCFPKDVKALVRIAKDVDFDPLLLNSVEARNEGQRRRLFEKVVTRFGPELSGRKFAIWGWAFKPRTDDMRAAPSLVLTDALLSAGARVVAYDPVATDAAVASVPLKWKLGGRLEFSTRAYEAAEGADALLLVTEWKQFRHPNFGRLGRTLAQRIVFDGSNQYDPTQMRQLGFGYFGIGH